MSEIITQNSKIRITKRDFLKENIRNLKNIQPKKPNKILSNDLIMQKPIKKFTNFTYGYPLNTMNVYERLTGSKIPTLRRSKGQQIILMEKQEQPVKDETINEQPIIEIIMKIDKFVQTFSETDVSNASFMNGSNIIEPSKHILMKIYEDKEKLKMAELKEKLSEKRKFDSDSKELEARLSDLKEYLETGSISRRKNTLEKEREELKHMAYDESFVQILKTTRPQSPPPPPPPTTDGNDEIKYTTDGNHIEKISKIPLRNSILIDKNENGGDGENGGGDDDDDGGLIKKQQQHQEEQEQPQIKPQQQQPQLLQKPQLRQKPQYLQKPQLKRKPQLLQQRVDVPQPKPLLLQQKLQLMQQKYPQLQQKYPQQQPQQQQQQQQKYQQQQLQQKYPLLQQKYPILQQKYPQLPQKYPQVVMQQKPQVLLQKPQLLQQKSQLLQQIPQPQQEAEEDDEQEEEDEPQPIQQPKPQPRKHDDSIIVLFQKYS